MRPMADMLSPFSLHTLGAVPLTIPSKPEHNEKPLSFSVASSTPLSGFSAESSCDPCFSRRESSSAISLLSTALSLSGSTASIPSLQSDCYEAPKAERQPRKPKFRESHSIEIVECPDNHPLIPRKPCLKASSLTGFDLEDEEESNLRPFHSTHPRGHFLDDGFSIAERAVYPDKEMSLFSRRYKLTLDENPKKHLRANSQYLRMYCAEREMLIKNKIRFIPSQPMLLPRGDTNKPGATKKELGIAVRWNHSRPRRVWRQLTADDFS